MKEDFNYFNYFTEIEEHFQRARGTSLFLLSPIDWALIETWKNSEIPIEAVLRGIDEAFEKWRSRKVKTQVVNSLAYCAQAVLVQAERASSDPSRHAEAATIQVAFPEEELRGFLTRNAAQVREAGDAQFDAVAESIDQLLAKLPDITKSFSDLEELEQHLTVLQARLIACARARETEEDAFAARREMDNSLRAYRSKMTAPQLAMLEAQFLERHTLERARLPHLSLFYLR